MTLVIKRCIFIKWEYIDKKLKNLSQFIYLAMDSDVKEIFRSLNWPTIGREKYSERPTPYNIAKNKHIGSSTVYRKWHWLFDQGAVKRVPLLPADYVVNRQLVFFSHASQDHFERLSAKMNRLYFLEMLHLGHVYYASGLMDDLNSGSGLILAELVDSSCTKAPRQAELLSEFMGDGVTTVQQKGIRKKVELDKKLIQVVERIAYSNLIGMSIDQVSSYYKVSDRTVQRWLNIILKSRGLIAYPLLDQSVIRGFDVAYVNAHNINGMGEIALLKKLREMPLVSERYLLYRFVGANVTLLIYYDSRGELDECIEQLQETFDSFVLVTRFRTSFNERVITNKATNS